MVMYHRKDSREAYEMRKTGLSFGFKNFDSKKLGDGGDFLGG